MWEKKKKKKLGFATPETFTLSSQLISFVGLPLRLTLVVKYCGPAEVLNNSFLCLFEEFIDEPSPVR